MCKLILILFIKVLFKETLKQLAMLKYPGKTQLKMFINNLNLASKNMLQSPMSESIKDHNLKLNLNLTSKFIKKASLTKKPSKLTPSN